MMGRGTATVVAADRSHLLCLDGNSLRELLMQMPEISLEMFRVLVERVRDRGGVKFSTSRTSGVHPIARAMGAPGSIEARDLTAQNACKTRE